jgi:hypothetical protein
MLELKPKMVLVKSSTDAAPCRLAAGIADQLDESGGNVILRDALMVDGDETFIVAAESCFEFDSDTRDAINALVDDAATLAREAKDKLAGAKMLAELGLQLAAFEVDDAALWPEQPTQEWITV